MKFRKYIDSFAKSPESNLIPFGYYLASIKANATQIKFGTPNICNKKQIKFRFWIEKENIPEFKVSQESTRHRKLLGKLLAYAINDANSPS